MAKRRRSQQNGSGLGLIGIVLGLGLLVVTIWFVVQFWVPLLLAAGCVVATMTARNAPQGRRTPWGVTAVGAGLLSLLGFNYIGSQLGQENSNLTANPATSSVVKKPLASVPTKQQVSAITGRAQPRKTTPALKPQTAQNPMVIDVHDGDTITVKYSNGIREKIRLLGVDAPELEQRPHGIQAKTYLRRLILNKRVRLESDQQTLDKFGRRLSYVYAGSKFINQRIVANGWALSSNIRPNTRYEKTLALAQRQARTANAGVWNSRSRLAITPSNWRKGIRPVRKPTIVTRAQPKPVIRAQPKPVRQQPSNPTPTYVAPVRQPEPVQDDVYFANCSAARAAGAAPISVGEPGYRSRLDRDNDGVACE
jgi:micrococcal nuclease